MKLATSIGLIGSMLIPSLLILQFDVLNVDGQSLQPNMAINNINYVCHCQDVGDVGPIEEGIICSNNSDTRLEGVTINNINPIIPRFAYQARLEDGTLTPWKWQGEFCGSKGQSIAIKGLAIKFVPENPFYSISYRLQTNCTHVPLCSTPSDERAGHDGQYVEAQGGFLSTGILVYITKKSNSISKPVTPNTPCPLPNGCNEAYGIDVMDQGGITFFRPQDESGNCTKGLASFPTSALVSLTAHSQCHHPIENKVVTVYKIIYK